MPTPTEMLEKKIRRREEALRARETETAAREAELQDLKESLQKLQAARSGIRGAIEDALSGENPNTIAPTDLLEMAVEGSPNTNHPFANGNITAEEAVKLALISMRKDLGSKGLVKMIIQTAIQVSQLDAEGVIKAALETVRASELTSSDVVRAALQASRNSNYIFAADLISPAVSVAKERGIEVPVIVKEAFVSTVRDQPSMVRTSVLSVLGCAMGMGMNHRDIKGIIKAFSKEIKLGEVTEARQSIAANTAGPSKVVRFESPSKPQNTDQTQNQAPENPKEPKKPEESKESTKPQEPQKAEPRNKKPGYGDDNDPEVVQAMVDAALESINNGGPGMPAIGSPFEMVAQWPGEYSAAYEKVDQILAERRRSARQTPEKIADYDDDGLPYGPANKKVKLNHRPRDERQ